MYTAGVSLKHLRVHGGDCLFGERAADGNRGQPLRQVRGRRRGRVGVAQHGHVGAIVRQAQHVGREPEDAAAVLHRAVPAQRGHLPAVAVAVGGAVGQLVGRPDLLERRPLHQFLGIERGIPRHEVVHRREQRAGRVGLRHAQRPRGLVPPGVAVRPPGDLRFVRAVAGVRHPERLEDALGHERRVALARHLLDDRAEQHVARVVVAVACARRELHRLVLEAVHQLLDGQVRLDLVRHPARDVGVALDARRVRQQVLHRDHVTLHRVAGQVLVDRVLQADLPLLDQHHDRERRELLGHRAEAEHRVGLQGHGLLDVREAAGAPVHHLAVLDDDGGGAGAAVLDRLFQDRIIRRRRGRLQRGLRQRGRGQNGTRQHGEHGQTEEQCVESQSSPGGAGRKSWLQLLGDDTSILQVPGRVGTRFRKGRQYTPPVAADARVSQERDGPWRAPRSPDSGRLRGKPRSPAVVGRWPPGSRGLIRVRDRALPGWRPPPTSAFAN